MTEIRKVFDPFDGKTVEISNDLVDRLRGRYAVGPTLPNGDPEFGWREFNTPPVQHEAAKEIERLRAALLEIASWKNDTLGVRPKQPSEYDCPQAVTEAFDRGGRMAFHRCADRASKAIRPPGE